MKHINVTWGQAVVDTAVWEHCGKTCLEYPYLPWEVSSHSVTRIFSLSCGLSLCWFMYLADFVILACWCDSQLDLRPALPLWTCLPITRLRLVQVPVSRHVIFAQMLWECIFWWWEHCSCLSLTRDPWLPVGFPLRSLSWLHPDTTMTIFLLHDVLILCSAVLNLNNTLLFHSCYHFVIILLSSFSL